MIELLINGQQIGLSDDFDIRINKSIADIRNPETRSSDFTRTLTIPGTSENNKVFEFLFDVANDITGGFNPNKKADCVVLVDGMPQIEGFIRLTDIINNNGRIEYQCTIHGESANLFTDIENAKLSDLNFGEYNHVCNITNIKDSWDNQIIVNGSPVSFAYGNGYVWTQLLPKRATNNTDINDWKADDHTPALYAKTIVDKIFSVRGYKYSTDSFFNSDRFKRLIIPFANNGLSSAASGVTERLFQAESSGQTINSSTQLLYFTNDATGGNFDNGSNYATGTSEYTVPDSGEYSFYLNFQGVKNVMTPIAASSQYILEFVFYVDGVKYGGDFIESNYSTTNWVFDKVIGFKDSFVQGQKVTVGLERAFIVVSPSLSWGAVAITNLQVGTGTYFYNASSAKSIVVNGTVDFGFFFDDKHTQKDFMISLIQMFNLYVEQTEAKTLRFVTRDDFYDGEKKDWTALLDYDQAHEIVPMGELQNNPYVFTYTEGTDTMSKEYKQKTSRIYGDRTLRVDNDFIKSEKKIELKFASTHLYNLNNKYFSLISDDKGQATNDLRILYYNGKKQVNGYFLYDTTKASTPNETNYPVTTHMDDPYNMGFDLLFGMPPLSNLPLGFAYSNQNLVNVYYYKTLAEIIDKNSKIFRGYFRINANQFANIRFNSLYFFEGQYWRLNKVIDYNPTQEGLTKCEFLLASYFAPSIPNTKPIGVGGQDTDNGKNPDFFATDGQLPIVNTKGSAGGLNSGDNIGSSDDSIVMGDGNSNYGIYNTIFAGSAVTIPLGFNNTTTINCDDFLTPEPERVYVENYPVVGAWLGAGKIVNITNTDSPYTVQYDDWLILCNTSGGSITVVLPTPSAANKGKVFVIKKTQSSNQVTIIAGDGSINIDDSTTHSENQKNGYDQVVSDGTQYWIITHGH
jgi:hypothetical protein